MTRKLLTQLKAVVENEKVRLTFYKSTPLFSSPEGEKRYLAVRIHRKTEPDFEFGRDYAEFFHGTNYRDARKIYEGRLKEYNLWKYEFIDKNVNVCQTYSFPDPAILSGL